MTAYTAIAIALLGLCGIADLATTLAGLKRGDSEANPVASPLIGLLGAVPALVLLKLVTTGTIVAVLLLRPAWWPLGALFAACYAAVLWNNIKVLRES